MTRIVCWLAAGLAVVAGSMQAGNCLRLVPHNRSAAEHTQFAMLEMRAKRTSEAAAARRKYASDVKKADAFRARWDKKKANFRSDSPGRR